MEIHAEDDWYITEPLKWFEAAGALFCPVRPHSKVPAYQAWQTILYNPKPSASPALTRV